MKNLSLIQAQIKAAQKKLTELEETRTALIKEICRLERLKQKSKDQSVSSGGSRGGAVVKNESPERDKITFFRSLFRGKEDIFARRFEGKRSGKSGYQPVCNNKWIRPVCRKPKVKCAVCENRDFTPLTDDVVRNHLIGKDPTDQYQREFVVGVYPMLADETCRLTHAMAARPEMGFGSYDRLFPSQDTLPKGGFGNLIALPFQRIPRTKGNSVFVDENMQP